MHNSSKTFLLCRTFEPEQPIKKKQTSLTGVHIPELDSVVELQPIEAKTAKRARRVLESDSEDDDEAPSTSQAVITIILNKSSQILQDAALAPLSTSKTTRTCAQLPAAGVQASLTCRITDVQVLLIVTIPIDNNALFLRAICPFDKRL